VVWVAIPAFAFMLIAAQIALLLAEARHGTTRKG
jgi:hypothetical protein